MPELGTKAVFLSYSRDDAAAARRVAEALRSSGLEVWFDENELRGGDSWDTKIRRQINDCTLFVAIISQHTEVRSKGYFRLEWKLAVEQTHMLLDGLPFIVPVVIDATPESSSAVPSEFMRVQWTRLPGALPTPQFVEQIKRLLDAPRQIATPARSVGTLAIGGSSSTKFLPWRWIALAAALVVAGVAFVALRPYEKAPSGASAPINSAPPQLSEARQLTAKAWALWEKQDDATRDDWELAEQLCQQAVTLDPTDGDVAAAQAQMTLAFNLFGFDRSQARNELARSQAQRAIRLAPDSNEAQFALANYYRRQSATREEGIRMLRQLVGRMPTDKRVLRTLASALRSAGQYADSIIYSDRANALPGGDPIALFGKEEALRLMGREAEGADLIDQVIAVHPTPVAILKKLYYALYLNGDLEEARRLIEKLPSASLLDEWGAGAAAQVWLWRREPEKAIAVLAAVPKDFIEKGALFTGPKAYSTGVARQMMGESEAARGDWQAALQVVEQRLKTQPTSTDLLGWRALLLAHLGRQAEAEDGLRVLRQLVKTGGTFTSQASIPVIMAALGEDDELIDTILPSFRKPTARLRFDPEFENLRHNPRFAAWLKTFEQQK